MGGAILRESEWVELNRAISFNCLEEILLICELISFRRSFQLCSIYIVLIAKTLIATSAWKDNRIITLEFHEIKMPFSQRVRCQFLIH
mgnify:CR=1 FL=1